MNKVILIGNLTKAVEIRQLTNGNILGNMSLAVNRHFVRNDGTKDTEVCYIDLVVYGKTAELCKKWLIKGSKISVEGRLVYQAWQTQSGEKRSKHVISVEKVEFLGTKTNNSNTQNNTQFVNSCNDEEIPF